MSEHLIKRQKADQALFRAQKSLAHEMQREHKRSIKEAIELGCMVQEAGLSDIDRGVFLKALLDLKNQLTPENPTQDEEEKPPIVLADAS